MHTLSADNPGERFSVVIVNYNGGDMLADCIRSALAEGVPLVQIVVVDNASTDGSLAPLAADFPGVPLLRNPCNAGFARAVNRGLGQATGELVLLLNNDAELETGALSAFAEAFDSIPKLAIAGGQLRYPDGRLQNALPVFPRCFPSCYPTPCWNG